MGNLKLTRQDMIDDHAHMTSDSLSDTVTNLLEVQTSQRRSLAAIRDLARPLSHH